jgi:tetratricopeptide (TPR) repeat protein
MSKRRSTGIRKSGPIREDVTRRPQPERDHTMRLFGKKVHIRWIALFIAATAFLLYAPTFHFGLTIWDDETNVRDNPYLQRVTADNLRTIWTKPYADLYIPLVYTSYAAELAVAGNDHWIHHVTNAALHAGSSALVFLLLVEWMGCKWATIIGALLFAVHPLQVEPVTWVTGRKDTLAGFLSLFSIWLYMRWKGTGKKAQYGGSLAMFVAALLAKPAAVSVPLMLAAIEWMHSRQQRVSSAAIALSPYFVIAAAWTLITASAQSISVPVALWMRPFVATDALSFYFEKLLFPIGLSPIYPHAPFEITGSWILYGSVIIVALIAGAVMAGGSNIRLGALLFLAGVLPVLGLKQFRYQNYSTVADRYVYLAMAGTALCCAALTERFARYRWTAWIATAVLAGFACVTLYQQQFWKASEPLVRRMIQIAPNSGPPRSMLAVVYLKQGKIDEMIRENRRSLKLLPHPDSYNNLAYSLMRKGEITTGPERARYFAESLQNYKIALQKVPNMSEAHDGMGRVYMNLGKLEPAAEAFRAAISDGTFRVGPYVNLGLTLIQLRQPQQAIAPLEKAVKMKPTADIQAYLAEAYLRSGRVDDAQRQIQQAARISPENPQVQQTLKLFAQTKH